jgi:hypothetical protein
VNLVANLSVSLDGSASLAVLSFLAAMLIGMVIFEVTQARSKL